MNRYDYEKLLTTDGTLSDILTYKETVENGFEGLSKEKRLAPRIMTPILSSYIYQVFEGKTRTWDPMFFSMLVVNSFFVGLICLQMNFYTKFLKKKVSLAPQILFLGSFGVNAIYLSGLIDSSLCFFIFIYIYNLLKKNYIYCWIFSILMCLSKETSFIYLIIFHASYLLNELFFEKKLTWEDFGFPFISVFVNLLFTNFLTLNYLNLNIIEYIFFSQEQGGSMNYQQELIDIVKFSFFLVPFIFFTYTGLKYINKKFCFLFLTCLCLHLIFLQLIINLDGNGVGRYLFNFLGPLFCLISGLGFQLYLDKNFKLDK